MEKGVIPGIKVIPVDTTAAGDVFNGALAVAISEGRSLKEAVIFANKAASVSVTRMGAQASAPFRNEIPLDK
jgi:ribokinase